jgi:hypothetical protein
MIQNYLYVRFAKRLETEEKQVQGFPLPVPLQDQEAQEALHPLVGQP